METAADNGLSDLAEYQERFLKEVKERLDLRNMVLLEIGSADGALARAMAREGTARVVGVDRKSPGNAGGGARSRDPLSSDRPHGEVRLLRMDAHRLPFAAGEFDAVVSLATLEHVANPAVVLAEVHRVLRPRGFFLARFAPIWTFATGHHYQVWRRDPEVHIPVWSHLYWDEKTMFDFLAKRHGTAPAGRAVKYIYRSREINRLPYRAYVDLLDATPFASPEVTPLVSEGFRPYLDQTRGRLPDYEMDELLVTGFMVALQKEG
jgi:SAM-dependent methyltransferase